MIIIVLTEEKEIAGDTFHGKPICNSLYIESIKTKDKQMQSAFFLHFKAWPSAGHKVAGAWAKATSQTD